MAHPIRTALRALIIGFAAAAAIAMLTGNYAAFSGAIGNWLTINVWPTVSAVSQAFANWFVAIFFPRP